MNVKTPACTLDRPGPLLTLLLVGLLGLLTGCSGFSYGDVYEGFFGYEPLPSQSRAVEMAFDETSADSRRRGLAALSVYPTGGETEFLAVYRQFVGDEDAGVRAAVASALGRHGQVEDAPRLIVLARDTDPLVRWLAADALRKVHSPDAIEVLLERLNDDVEDDADTRAAAALALGQYPERVVLLSLIGAMEQPNYDVALAARHSLVLLTGHDAGIDPADWAGWSDRTTEPFANQKPYVYDVYDPRLGWCDRYLTFWNNPDYSPRRPTGLDDAGG